MEQKYLKIGESLQHVGVIGMRWGRRKSTSQSANSNHKSRKQLKADAKEAKKNLKKKNEERIINEITTQHGAAYATKFLKTHDDLEMWDLYSKEELDLFNDLESSGGFDDY